MKNNISHTSSTTRKIAVSQIPPFIQFIIFCALFTVTLELFGYFDWDCGVQRFILLIIAGILVCLADRFAFDGSLKFYSKRIPIITAIVFLMIGLYINANIAWHNIISITNSSQLKSDQATTTLRAISLLRSGINPYSKNTFLDPVAYEFALNDLDKNPGCASHSPPVDYILEKKIVDGAASVEEMNKFQLVESDNQACSPIKKRFESMGLKYGPVLMLGYMPFTQLFGPRGIIISNCFFMSLLLVLMFRWSWKISQSWFLTICSPLLLLSSIHLRWNIFDKGHSDILPTFLAMLFLFLFSNKKYLLASISLALCVTTKTTPGILFLPILIMTPPYLLITIAAILLIYSPFIVWDWKGLLNNLMYPYSRPPDSTAIAYYLNHNIMILLIIILGIFCTLLLLNTIKNGFDLRKVINLLIYLHLALLATAGQFHNNYLVWLLPLLSLFLVHLFGYRRNDDIDFGKMTSSNSGTI